MYFLAAITKLPFDQIFNEHTLPEVPSFYVHAPKRTRSAAAPEGQDTLYVLVPVGHLDARTEQDWDAMVKRARETVLNRLAKEMGVTDLESHIKFEIVYSPKLERTFQPRQRLRFRAESQLLAGRLSASA